MLLLFPSDLSGLSYQVFSFGDGIFSLTRRSCDIFVFLDCRLLKLNECDAMVHSYGILISPFCIVMEYMSMGTLDKYLQWVCFCLPVLWNVFFLLYANLTLSLHDCLIWWRNRIYCRAENPMGPLNKVDLLQILLFLSFRSTIGVAVLFFEMLFFIIC